VAAAIEEGNKAAMAGKEKADEAIAAYSKVVALTTAAELTPTEQRDLQQFLEKAERGLAIAYTAKDDEAAAVEHYRKYLALVPYASDGKKVRDIIDRYDKKTKAKSK
jgi:hypothetical protein